MWKRVEGDQMVCSNSVLSPVLSTALLTAIISPSWSPPSPSSPLYPHHHQDGGLAGEKGKSVTIGDVTMELKEVLQPQLVPHSYSPVQFTQVYIHIYIYVDRYR
jgi:hypothetical protein